MQAPKSCQIHSPDCRGRQWESGNVAKTFRRQQTVYRDSLPFHALFQRGRAEFDGRLYLFIEHRRRNCLAAK
jgi:hypothetical protein